MDISYNASTMKIDDQPIEWTIGHLIVRYVETKNISPLQKNSTQEKTASEGQPTSRESSPCLSFTAVSQLCSLKPCPKRDIFGFLR